MVKRKTGKVALRKSNLTPKQREARAAKYELFCLEYVKDQNAARAARDAGYSKHTAREQGCMLLTRPNIKTRVKQLLDERNARVLLEADEILLSIKNLAVSDPRRLCDPKTGCVLPMDEWPDDVAQCVASFEVIERFHPVTGRLTGYVKKIKLWDKPKSQENLGRNKGLFKDVVESKVNAKVSVVDPVEALSIYKKIDDDC